MEMIFLLVLRDASDTAVIVLHEIYGINKNIKSKCARLHGYGFDVYCPNLLNRNAPFEYTNEKEAYINFFKTVSVDESVQRIKTIVTELRHKYKYVFILGYSVGATISWLCSQHEKNCDGIICFYGSRIRDYVSIKPKCPVKLYFASTEISFDVHKLINLLENKKNIAEIKTYNGEHGFADEFSEKFNLEAYQSSHNDMLEFIKGIKKHVNY